MGGLSDDHVIDTAAVRSASGARPKAAIAPISKPARKNKSPEAPSTSSDAGAHAASKVQVKTEPKDKPRTESKDKVKTEPIDDVKTKIRRDSGSKPSKSSSTGGKPGDSPLRSPQRSQGSRKQASPFMKSKPAMFGNPFLRTRPKASKEDGPETESFKMEAMDKNLPKASFGGTDNGTRWSRKTSGSSALYRMNAPLKSSAGSSLSDAEKFERLRDFFESVPDHDDEDEPPIMADSIIPGLKPRLLKHQVRGVKFMSSREGSRVCQGGLLCDSMGLGKTVQMLGLILKCPPKEGAKIKTTLVVAPLAVLDQWKEEIQNKAPKLTVEKHHGPSRTTDYAELARNDIVLTTYDVVKSEFRGWSKDKENTKDKQVALFTGSWYRIVLDEAHVIRNGETQGTKAVLELKSSGRRWGLTGTPVHNTVEDFLPLFQFVDAPDFNEAADFEKLANAFRYSSAEHNDAMARFKKVLKLVMLSRTQRVLRDHLPPIERMDMKVKLSAEESNNYKHVDGSGMHLMLVRMASDGLVPGNIKTEPLDGKADKSKMSLSSLVDEDDLASLLGGMNLDEKKIEPNSNSKCQTLLDILGKERGRKTVVFSNFVRMLDWIGKALDENGIRYRKYTGSLTPKARSDVLADYKNSDEDIQVLLCSLQCASVGLNITAASQVVMMEPWWNPQIIDQAVGRVHRLGQTRPVLCYELYSVRTIEERIMKVLERKRKMAASLMETSKLSKEEKEFIRGGPAKGKKH